MIYKNRLVNKALQDCFGFYLEHIEKSSQNCEWKSDIFKGHFQKITVDVKRGGKVPGHKGET